MGSTGESDRKRRHFSSISPTAAATVKKHPFMPSSEDKKLDNAVLQFQNQKLVQKLEAQKVERFTLENKFSQLKEKQQPYDTTLTLVNKSWEELLDELESRSAHTRETLSRGQDVRPLLNKEGSSPPEDILLSRLIETGATESCSSINSQNQMEEDGQATCEKTENILRNIEAAVVDLCSLKDGLFATVLKSLPQDDTCRQSESRDLHTEVKSLRLAIRDLHLKHRSLAGVIQSRRDTDARDKSELQRLTGELESIIADLEESNSKLAAIKAEKDATKGAFFPVLNLGSKHVSGDKARDKQKDIQEMESSLKDLLDQASSRLLELKSLHEERIGMLKQLSNMQNALKNVKLICSSEAYVLVRDQLEKSKAEVIKYQSIYEKLQAEKDNLTWREREVDMKSDLIDVSRRSSAVSDSRITELGIEIQKQIDDKFLIERKLEEASRERGRKEIIAEFKALVSSFPKDMGIMQSQLSQYKEASSDVHSLRADVQSLSSILDRKTKEWETLSAKSVDQVAKIQKLRAVVHDLKESEAELNLILEMYRRETTESRDVLEARDMEYKAWAHVQGLKSSLDEHNLELRVKTANEAEAISQQRLAAAEAEIAELRQKSEASKRDMSGLSEGLKSKHEEIEAYLSEIETIGQAYDDMQTQNQHLLQQITERDDYNIKLVLEGVRATQQHNAQLLDKHITEKEIQQANTSLNLYDAKASKIEDQLRICTDQVQKHAEDRAQNSAALENTQKRSSDVRRASQQARVTLEESQSKVDRSRVRLMELQIDLEKERFDKKRIEEELEIARRKVLRLREQREGSSAVEKLQEELTEYREILKCSICLDRTKEVVITKCYHLFCSPCVQGILETRHRKCPVCAASFGPNDVKPVYI